MKFVRSCSMLAMFVSLAVFSSSNAAVITWTGASLSGTGTSNISNLGTLVEAHNTGANAAALAAGGVLFDNVETNPLGTVFFGANPGNITGDANFDAILNSASYATSSVTYNIDSLVAGTQYLVQFFVADSRVGIGAARTVTVSDLDGGTSHTSGQMNLGYVFTGTFTASGASQAVEFSGFAPDLNPDGNVPYMNAWQLRDVTAATAAVPEPASMCIWASLALVATAGAYRRRRLQGA